MKVEILNQGNLGDLKRYWSISRPHLTESELPSVEEILKMGLPVSGLINYTLSITGPIFLRDLLYTVRPVQPWAVSGRATPITSSNTYIDPDIAKLIPQESLDKLNNDISNVVSDINSGMLQEYCKSRLPIACSTTFIVQYDLRTLINVLYTLEVHNKPLFFIFGDKVLSATNLDKYYYKDIIPKKDILSEVAVSGTVTDSGTVGDMRYIHKEINYDLLAQVIRKHDAIVKTSSWKWLSEDPTRLYTSVGTDDAYFDMYITNESLSKMISTRTCFFAKMDRSEGSSWDRVIGDLVRDMTPEEFLSQLPCGGHCPCHIEADMIPRINGKEPNPPCPILIGYPQVISDRIEAFGSNSHIMDKWKECIPYIKLDPNNKYINIYLDRVRGDNV